MNAPLIKLSIIHLLRFADTFAGIEVHVSVNEKFVRLNYAQDQFVDILRKLQQKDVEHVYVNQTDCRMIVEHVSKSLTSKTFYDPKTIPSDRVEALNSAHENVKYIINQLGVDRETVRLLKTINNRSLSLLGESPTIFAFVNEFKKNCSEEFLRAILTNYIMSLVIDKFTWGSDQVKMKGALASFMCDMVLNKDDFQNLRDWKKGGELQDKVKSHPEEISNKLKQNRNVVPHETITIIEQHHERPNGSGFPYGITTTKFNQLSAIFIVCQQFTEQLHESDYDYQKRTQIISDLQNSYDYGSSKVFRKAFNALVTVVH
jgi:hypothetical protein